MSTAAWWHGGCRCRWLLHSAAVAGFIRTSCSHRPWPLKTDCRGQFYSTLAATCVSVFDACLPCSDQHCSLDSLPNLAAHPCRMCCLPVHHLTLLATLLLGSGDAAAPEHTCNRVGSSCNSMQHPTTTLNWPSELIWLPHIGGLKPHVWGPCSTSIPPPMQLSSCAIHTTLDAYRREGINASWLR